MRGAFLIDVWRVHSVFNEGRLMFDGLVYDGVELMIRHDRKHVGHQLVLGLKILIMLGCIREPLPSLLRAPGDFSGVRRPHCFLARFKRWIGASVKVQLERFHSSGGASSSLSEQLLELWNSDRVDEFGAGGFKFRNSFVENFRDFFKIFRKIGRAS